MFGGTLTQLIDLTTLIIAIDRPPIALTALQKKMKPRERTARQQSTCEEIGATMVSRKNQTSKLM